jgi:Domain of unknown function (DUF6371)
MKRIDFDQINRAALANLPALLGRVLPSGKQAHREWIALNPRRADRHLGSFKVNRYNGRWPILPLATMVGIPSRSWHTSRASRRLRLPGVLPGCSALIARCAMKVERLGNDKFAPLTPEERAAAAAFEPKEPEGDLIVPVSADPPQLPESHFALGRPSMTWVYRDAHGNVMFYVLRFETPDGKETRPLSLWKAPNGRVEWRWKGVPVPRPLYGLHRLAADPDAPVVVCEGEKAADAATNVFSRSACITSPGGSKAANRADWTPLAGRKVLIWPDADEPGTKYANQVAAILHGQSCEVSIINAMALARLTPGGDEREHESGWDAADAIAEWQDLKALRRAAKELAKPYEPGEPEFDREIARLSKLKPLEYERERSAAVKNLGVRATVLDKLIKDAWPSEQGQGRALELPEPEPWGLPVDGAARVAELEREIKKYVVLPPGHAFVASLWVLHSYCFDAFPCTPRLAITAPEKRCGKTTLLDVIMQLVPRVLSTANISAPATFRTIESSRPTLLIDEAEAFLGDNEELRGVLNSGHRAGGQVIRSVGDGFEPRVFSTHCPVAIAQIGKLPSTLSDRSIPIEMKRRTPGETVARFRIGRTPELAEAARKATRWVADNANAIREPRRTIGRLYLPLPRLLGAMWRNAQGKSRLPDPLSRKSRAKGPCSLPIYAMCSRERAERRLPAPNWWRLLLAWQTGRGQSAIMERR